MCTGTYITRAYVRVYLQYIPVYVVGMYEYIYRYNTEYIILLLPAISTVCIGIHYIHCRTRIPVYGRYSIPVP